MNIKDTIYWQIFSDIWAFFKRHAEIRQIDWQVAVDEASMLGGRYENTPQFEFVKRVVLATMDELERIGGEKTDA